MILADKIIQLRKKNGWSQEELAEKMQVSRQAVSKWEGAQAVPDLEKILRLGQLFGVTTDYLLKDELEREAFADGEDDAPVRRVTLAQVNEYLDWRERASLRIAAATFLCIVSPIPLMLLGAATEVPAYGLSEGFAAAAGLIALLLLVAVAVVLYLRCGFQNAPYAFLDKEPFDTEYGVNGMVRQRQEAYKAIYARGNIAGACLCVLSPVPLFLAMVWDRDFLSVLLLCLTLLLAAIGVVCFIVVGVRWASMQKLLRQGDFDPAQQRERRVKEAVASAYWLTATAVYLLWSFLSNDWQNTWVVWPVAGVLYPVVLSVCTLLTSRKE